MRKLTVLVGTVLFLAAVAVASASTKIIPHPDPSRSLSAKLDWALASAPGDNGFWIAYTIERQMPSGTFFNGDWMWHQHRGIPLADLLAGRTSTDDMNPGDGAVLQEIAILLRYPSAGAPPKGVSVASLSVPVDWRRPVLWLGPASTEESFERLTDLYRASASDAFKEDLMDAVGVHDMAAAVDFLAGVLGSRENAEIREEAAEALAWQTDPRAVSVLEKAIERDVSAKVREEAVEALGEIGSEAAVAVLEDVLWSGRDVRLQDEALESLVESSQDRSLPILIEVARNHPSAEVREEAVEYLAEIAADRAVAVLEEVAMNDRSFAVRTEALEILAELPGGAGLPFVVKIARTHPDGALRAEAVDVLADSDDPRARRALQMWGSE